MAIAPGCRVLRNSLKTCWRWFPPVCFDHHPALGCHFGCGKPWDHTPEGRAIYLMFRSRPRPACRMATVSEFRAECFATIPPGWQLLTPEEVTTLCERQFPGERGQWQSKDFKRGTEGAALRAVHGDSLFHIEGRGWFVPE